jgi:hypothetical protein
VVVTGASHEPTAVFIGEIRDSIAVTIVDDLLQPTNSPGFGHRHEKVAETVPLVED